MNRYDLVLGVGTACSCSQTIRTAGLQFLSFPFDWLTPLDHREDLRRRADCLCDGFPGWLKEEDFSCLGELSSSGRVRYLNKRLNFYFLHDFPEDRSMKDAFGEVRAKYERRITRLLNLLQRAKRILLVRLDLPGVGLHTSLDDCRFARRRLAGRFPQATFDLVLFQPDDGRTFESRTVEEIEPGLLRIAFDYRDLRPGALPHQVDTFRTGAALKRICSVRDYRTSTERILEHKRKILKRLHRLRTSVRKRLRPVLALFQR